MSPKSTIAIAGLILIVAVGYYFSLSETPNQPVITEPAEVSATDLSEQQTTQTQQPVAPGVSEDTAESRLERFDAVRGQMVEMEKVQGLMVRADRNCTVKLERYKIEEDGTQTPVYSCKPNEPVPLDIYNTYSTETLKELAYYDTHAAHKLAVRLRESDFPQAVDYAVRATALSGDGKYIGSMTNLMTVSYTKDDKPNPEYIAQAYVISGIASAYDARIKTHANWARDAHNLQGNGIDIEALNARISNYLLQIDSIRAEVGLD